MISCRLLTVTANAKGAPTRNETRVAGESIVVGRGSACQIHLPDHRVSLQHATIKRQPDGKLQVEAAHDAMISIDGYLQHSADLLIGTEIGVGPYRLTVDSTVDHADLTLTVDLPAPLLQPADTGDSASTHPAALNLAGLGISKRRIGFALALLILLAFFFLPLITKISPAFEAWQARLLVPMTSMLNPGALSVGHGQFGMKCSSCHQKAFQAVTDSACTECHTNAAMHLPVDHTHLNLLGNVRCADCHPSHQGKAGAMRDGLTQCVGCHQRLDNVMPEVRDFAVKHPPFQLTIPAGKENVRVKQGDQALPPENSGLKFSHQVHLDKSGVSSPDGRTLMTCTDCHKLEPAGDHFAPINMKMSCQQSRCHTIRFEEPARGIVPHGSERQVMDRLRIFFAQWLAEEPGQIAASCAQVPKTGHLLKHTLDCADALALDHAGKTLFKQEGELECALCHEITPTGKKDSPWKVATVRLRHDWQPKAHFDHAKHGTLACTECHDKADSKTSEEISFPEIGQCRECHTGSRAATGKIISQCETCHRFHRVTRLATP